MMNLKDFGEKLLDNNIPITVLYGYSKAPKDYLKYGVAGNWKEITEEQMRHLVSFPDVTGVGVIPGRALDTKENKPPYLGLLDPDIYNNPKLLRAIFDRLMWYFSLINKDPYWESTTSGALHFIIKHNIKADNDSYNGQRDFPIFLTDDTDYKVQYDSNNKKINNKIQLFLKERANHVLVAPSQAYKGDGSSREIGQYTKLSKVDIWDAPVLDEQELNGIIKLLADVSEEYSDKDLYEKHYGNVYISNWQTGKVEVTHTKCYADRLRELNMIANFGLSHLDELLFKHMNLADIIKYFDWDSYGSSKCKIISNYAKVFRPDNTDSKPGLMIWDNSKRTYTNKDGTTKVATRYVISDSGRFDTKGTVSLASYMMDYGDQNMWGRLLSFAKKHKLDKDSLRISLDPLSAKKRYNIQISTPNIDEQTSDKILKIIKSYVIERRYTDKILRIVICAPTGIGKTYMIGGFMKGKRLKCILTLAYKAHVDQAIDEFENYKHIYCMRGGITFKPNKYAYVTTYDKTKDLLDNAEKNLIDLTDFEVVFVDEAHNLTAQKGFRWKAIDNVNKLTDEVKCIVYVTATPEYIDYKKVDCFINITRKETPNLTYKRYNCHPNSTIETGFNHLISNYSKGFIHVVLLDNKAECEIWRTVIEARLPGTEVRVLNADLKHSDPGEETEQKKVADRLLYTNVVEEQTLADQTNGMLIDGGVVLMTTLMSDGVNIKDNNVRYVSLIEPKSPTHYIQFPARFRNRLSEVPVYCFCSGRKLDKNGDPICDKSRNQYLYYHIDSADAELQYEQTISRPLGRKIRLSKLKYQYLRNRVISDDLLLKHMAQTENHRLNSDDMYLKDYLEKDWYNYNAIVDIGAISTTNDKSIKKVYKDGKVEYNNLLEQKHEKFKLILSDYTLSDKKDLLFLFLKRHQSTKIDGSHEFQEMVTGIGDRKLSFETIQTFNSYISINKKMLYVMCVGLKLGIDKLSEFINSDIPMATIKIISKAYDNVVAFDKYGNNIRDDQPYYRFCMIRDSLILKYARSHNNIVPIEVFNVFRDLKINKECKCNYRKDRNDLLIADIKTVCEFEAVKSGNQYYQFIAGKIWTYDNCYGLKTNQVHWESGLDNLNFYGPVRPIKYPDGVLPEFEEEVKIYDLFDEM